MNKIITTCFVLAGLNLFGQLQNLGKLANSKYEEISPYITPDGSKIFFIREDHPNNTLVGETQDVWWCQMKNDSITSEAKHLGFPFNTLRNNSINSQTPDGQLRMLKGVFDKYGQYKKSGYSYTVLTAEGWSDPKPMNIKGYANMNKGKYVGMCLVPSGNVMILSFSEIKDNERSELYISRRIDDDTWSKPEKIHGSKNGDFAPFIASDNKTMYFSAYERGGYGNADIFVTKRLDETWLNWSEPVNLGDSINTSDWDAYFKVSPTGKYAFLVSSVSGNSDLYRLPLFSKAVKPDPVIIVEGVVKDAETGKPLQSSLEYTNLANNTQQGIGRSSMVDGSYKIILPYGSNFSIGARLPGYYAENLNLDLSKFGEFAVVKRDILLKPIKAETVIRLNNIFFETAKAVLLPTSQNELDGLIRILTENAAMKIEIRGHTDNVGSDASNQTLSENRAKAVVEYLTSKGIAADRLVYKGFGESTPVASNETEEGRAVNRRVEFRIVSVN